MLSDIVLRNHAIFPLTSFSVTLSMKNGRCNITVLLSYKFTDVNDRLDYSRRRNERGWPDTLKSPARCLYMFRGSEAITGVIARFFACRSKDINCVR